MVNKDNKPVNQNQTNKKNQYKVLYVVLALVAIVVIGITQINTGTSTAEVVEQPQVSIPTENISANVLWRENTEEEIDFLVESEKELRETLNSIKDKLSAIEVDIHEKQIFNQENDFELELLKLASLEQDNDESPPQINAIDSVPNDEVGFHSVQPAGISLIRVNATTQVPSLDINNQADAPANLTDIKDEIVDVMTPGKKVKHSNYLPGGTFMKAVILGGIDAPTGNVSRDNPHPVLLRVADEAQLPNLAKLDLKECLVLAAGYGEISSERALLRTERMSCQRPDKTFFDSVIHGFIVGEDGRAGVRGKLVTKQGQILQRSLLAGIGSGFSDIFRSRYADQIQANNNAFANQATNNTTNTIDISEYQTTFGDYATSAFASGASNALGRLADYYMRLADRTHPIIEIGAGRTVDIVLQEGVDLNADPRSVQEL